MPTATMPTPLLEASDVTLQSKTATTSLPPTYRGDFRNERARLGAGIPG